MLLLAGATALVIAYNMNKGKKPGTPGGAVLPARGTRDDPRDDAPIAAPTQTQTQGLPLGAGTGLTPALGTGFTPTPTPVLRTGGAQDIFIDTKHGPHGSAPTSLISGHPSVDELLGPEMFYYAG